MISIKAALFLALAVVASVFVGYWFLAARRARAGARWPIALEFLLGFATNFFDTLGIGSFAPTTSVFKLRRMVPDEHIPGTLNIGHCLPAVTQAFIFIAIIQVDMSTLLLMIAAAVAGAWLGAGIVAGWPRRNVQIGMGFALLAAATVFTMTNLGLFPAGGNTLDLQGGRLWGGLIGNFALGALMTIGIGLYGPCMILVSLLGMDPKAAFPIMMGACAFLMPVASIQFIRKGAFEQRQALGLVLGGIPAVFLAAYVVKELPLTAVRWLVVIVVLYTAAMMLRSAFGNQSTARVNMKITPMAVAFATIIGGAVGFLNTARWTTSI
jgi:uncharacterized membrane protein YfcA